MGPVTIVAFARTSGTDLVAPVVGPSGCVKLGYGTGCNHAPSIALNPYEYGGYGVAPLSGPTRCLVVSLDGRSVYLAVDRKILTLVRDPTTGGLTAGSPPSPSFPDSLTGLALSPDVRFLYASTNNNNVNAPDWVFALRTS
jgi:hypothetical protein